MKFVPPEFLLDAHHWLILHGRYVCKARRPCLPGLHHRGSVRVPAQDSRMSVFDSYSREQLRLAYAEAWAKHVARSP